jgi:ribonuclease Z
MRTPPADALLATIQESSAMAKPRFLASLAGHSFVTIVALVAGAAFAATRPLSTVGGPVDAPATADSFKVILLGTGVGPRVDLQQYGASILVEAGGERFLFDCGRGATMRLSQAGIPLGSISRVFLTHLHSDHVVQLPDLLLTGWAVGRRAGPLEVWGPPGTRAMMDHLQQAFAFDIHMRRDVDEHFPAAGIAVASHDVQPGAVYAGHGVTVTAFRVDHGPVRPALGYRVDYHGRSVVLSGDTRPSENLIRHARGVDVLIHEAIDPDALRARPDRPSDEVIAAIIAHHTTPEQAGEVFQRVRPRLAVYSHAPNTGQVLARTRTTYLGPLQGAEDLLTIVIGDEVTVRHAPPSNAP